MWEIPLVSQLRPKYRASLLWEDDCLHCWMNMGAFCSSQPCHFHPWITFNLLNLLLSDGSPFLSDDRSIALQIHCIHALGLFYYWLCFHKPNWLLWHVVIMKSFRQWVKDSLKIHASSVESVAISDKMQKHTFTRMFGQFAVYFSLLLLKKTLMPPK